ncbi:NAD-dependent isocitrate dehydrogenase [Puccinia graminis f. sp. tritici]|uniref:NAD-dependent isocitrate dehydrogenase n=1 Tax=Puccinia graminis f. sp. tritici TaxID=56615 RepID=A0A5B0QYQ6_PUCGR|nr:NAD-dependent isocitrate dehydrogenase [Puccinia graminis f. sp. tritici]
MKSAGAKRSSRYIWCIKPCWAQSQVPLGRVPRGLGNVPRGLDWATCAGLGSWHTAKSRLADPKRWANGIIDIPQRQRFTIKERSTKARSLDSQGASSWLTERSRDPPTFPKLWQKSCVPATAGTTRERQGFTVGGVPVIRRASLVDVVADQDGWDLYGLQDASVPSTHEKSSREQLVKLRGPVNARVPPTLQQAFTEQSSEPDH